MDTVKQLHTGLVEVESEQLTLLSGPSIAKGPGRLKGQAAQEADRYGPVTTEESSFDAQVLDLMGPGSRKGW